MYDLIELIRKNKKIFIANAAVSMVVFLLVFGIFAGFNLSGQSRLGNLIEAILPGVGIDSLNLRRLELSNDENRIISVVESSNPSVVSIVATKNIQSVGPSFLEGEREVGGGTGFLVSPDGLIVTNKHVVDDPSAVYSVYTYDGKKYEAKIAAKDPTQDIAIVRISGEEFPYLTFGDSDKLMLGQTVIAIGNVFDQFKNSVSVGVVSGLSRSIIAGDLAGNTEVLENVIQTDAAINPGNSGGPLLDTQDRVIGVNVAIARGSENVGFALPSNIVRSAVNSVLRVGKILRPYLGVRYVAVTPAIQEEFSLQFEHGVLVMGDNDANVPAVANSSPADRAGIVEGDVILEVDGDKLTEDKTLANIFQRKNAGEIVDLKVWHNGQIRDIKIKLDEFPIK